MKSSVGNLLPDRRKEEKGFIWEDKRKLETDSIVSNHAITFSLEGVQYNIIHCSKSNKIIFNTDDKTKESFFYNVKDDTTYREKPSEFETSEDILSKLLSCKATSRRLTSFIKEIFPEFVQFWDGSISDATLVVKEEIDKSLDLQAMYFWFGVTFLVKNISNNNKIKISFLLRMWDDSCLFDVDISKWNSNSEYVVSFPGWYKDMPDSFKERMGSILREDISSILQKVYNKNHLWKASFSPKSFKKNYSNSESIPKQPTIKEGPKQLCVSMNNADVTFYVNDINYNKTSNSGNLLLSSGPVNYYVEFSNVEHVDNLWQDFYKMHLVVQSWENWVLKNKKVNKAIMTEVRIFLNTYLKQNNLV